MSGCGRVAESIYGETRAIIKMFLEGFIKTASDYMENARKKIYNSDIFHVTHEHLLGTKFYSGAYQFCKSNKILVEKIRHGIDCLVITRIGFSRLVREIAQDFYPEDAKFNKEFILDLQYVTEHYLRDLFTVCSYLLKYKNVDTLKPATLRLARRIACGEIPCIPKMGVRQLSHESDLRIGNKGFVQKPGGRVRFAKLKGSD